MMPVIVLRMLSCMEHPSTEWHCGPLVKAVHGCPPLFQFLTMLCENGIDPQSHDAGRNCQSNPGFQSNIVIFQLFHHFCQLSQPIVEGNMLQPSMG